MANATSKAINDKIRQNEQNKESADSAFEIVSIRKVTVDSHEGIKHDIYLVYNMQNQIIENVKISTPTPGLNFETSDTYYGILIKGSGIVIPIFYKQTFESSPDMQWLAGDLTAEEAKEKTEGEQNGKTENTTGPRSNSRSKETNNNGSNPADKEKIVEGRAASIFKRTYETYKSKNNKVTITVGDNELKVDGIEASIGNENAKCSVLEKLLKCTTQKVSFSKTKINDFKINGNSFNELGSFIPSSVLSPQKTFIERLDGSLLLLGRLLTLVGVMYKLKENL